MKSCFLFRGRSERITFEIALSTLERLAEDLRSLVSPTSYARSLAEHLDRLLHLGIQKMPLEKLVVLWPNVGLRRAMAISRLARFLLEIIRVNL
jgi:hypothetical protein